MTSSPISDDLRRLVRTRANGKGSDLATIDPISGKIVPLFNPRIQLWNDHFTLNNAQIEGITAIGRATARLIMLNAPTRLLERQVLIVQGQYP